MFLLMRVRSQNRKIIKVINHHESSFGWIKLKIQSLAMDWLHSRRKHQKLTEKIRDANDHKYSSRIRTAEVYKDFYLNVTCMSCKRNQHSPVDPLDQTGSYRPFLLLDYKRKVNQIKSRKKRNLKCGEGIQDCCSESLYISFNKIGLNFIIDPPGYYANFCLGACNRAVERTLDHNILVNQYLMKNEVISRRLGILSCCSPTKYKDLKIVFINKNNGVTNGTLSNVVAESCGCK